MLIRPDGIGWFFVLPLAFVLGLVAYPARAEEKQAPGDKVAVVNGSEITREDFEDEMSRVERLFSNRGTSLNEPQLSQVKREVLESLINRELLYQESQRKGIGVEQSAVDDRMRALKGRFSTEGEFKSALSQMNLSEAEVESQIKREMVIQKLIDEQFADKITVSDDEIRTYYDSNPDLFRKPEEVRASHILIKVDPGADESDKAEARKKIEKIQERLQKGEDFAALATEFSEGPSGPRGGDLNYFKRGQMVKPFEDTAFELEPDEVSGVVETRFGYHLIKVTDKRPETTIAYGDIKERIGDYLRQQKIQGETKRFVQELKAKAEVKRFMDVEP
ncbi:MAG: peptidylprolyl isomerase [Proteobacteria bacterium]|nr:peptidylprolyl isomerase [Pseudomonadota bacterium]